MRPSTHTYNYYTIGLLPIAILLYFALIPLSSNGLEPRKSGSRGAKGKKTNTPILLDPNENIG